MNIFHFLKSVKPPVPEEIEPEAVEKRKAHDEKSKKLQKVADDAKTRFEASLHELDILLSRGQDVKPTGTDN